MNNTIRRKALPILSILLGDGIFGFSFLLEKIALRSSPPEMLLSFRFLMTVIFMLLFSLLTGTRLHYKGKNLKPILLLGISEPLYFYFESYGVLYTNATFAGVILSAVPIFALVMAILFLKEYPTRLQAIFCLLPIAGIIMITLSGNKIGAIRAIGVVFLIATCLSSAMYKTANRKSSEEFTPFERTFFVMSSCAIVFTIAALFRSGWNLKIYAAPLKDTSFVLSCGSLALCCSFLANVCMNYAAGKLPVVTMATFGSVTTLVSMFCGVVLLKEPMTAMMWTGTLLILLGVFVVSRGK